MQLKAAHPAPSHCSPTAAAPPHLRKRGGSASGSLLLPWPWRVRSSHPPLSWHLPPCPPSCHAALPAALEIFHAADNRLQQLPAGGPLPLPPCMSPGVQAQPHQNSLARNFGTPWRGWGWCPRPWPPAQRGSLRALLPPGSAVGSGRRPRPSFAACRSQSARQAAHEGLVILPRARCPAQSR
jgi:hypothetical protein